MDKQLSYCFAISLELSLTKFDSLVDSKAYYTSSTHYTSCYCYWVSLVFISWFISLSFSITSIRICASVSIGISVLVFCWLSFLWLINRNISNLIFSLVDLNSYLRSFKSSLFSRFCRKSISFLLSSFFSSCLSVLSYL